MAELALAAASSWFGGTFFAAGAFGLTGAQIGWAIGSFAGSLLFGPDMPDQQGPRLTDKTVQSSAYGTMIPISKGRARFAGNIIWSTDLVEQSHSQSYGGKGGGGGTSTTFSYYANAAISICEGEKLVRKVWADGQLIYDITSTNTGYTGSDLPIRFYTGSETQEPDPLIESVQGVGATPAYRGQCYMVMEQFALEKYGNRIPNFTFEVVDGSLAYPAVVDLGTGTRGTFDNVGRLWVVSSNTTVDVWDTATQTILVSNTVDALPTGNISTAAHTPFYVEELDEIWVSNASSGSSGTGAAIWRFSAISLSEIGTIRVTATGTPIGTSMAYSPTMRKIILFNNYTGVNTARLIDIDTLIVSSAPGYSGSVTYSLAIPAHSIAVSHGPNITGLLITSLVDGGKMDLFVGDVVDSSTGEDVYYDEDLDALLWVRIEAGFGKIRQVNLPGFDVVDHALPTPPGDGASITKDNGFYYIGSPNTAGSGYLLILDSDFNTVDLITINDTSNDAARMFMIDDKLWGVGGSIGVGILPHVKMVTSADPTLASIITYISESAGLSASDIDVTGVTENVTGWFVTRQAPARSLLEPLLAAYRYEGVETG
jgi:hypothetical protein